MIGRFFRRIRAVPVMLKDRSVVRWKKAIVIFGMIYVFVPFDLIPTFIPAVGILDDLAIWIAITVAFGDTLDGYYGIRSKRKDFSKKYEKEKTVKDVEYEVHVDSEEEK